MTDVGQTFRQHEILLTGSNGFLGKVLLGLLLDRYPDFKHLHVLIRPGKLGLSGEERFEREVLSSPCLAPIVKAPGFGSLREKITVWSGDVSVPECGLGAHGLDALQSRVGLIVNCAGLVEFFPPLDRSLRANVDSVENLAGLARHSGAKLLHVSTCYVAGRADGLIEETEPVLGFYPLRKGPEDTRFDHAAERAYCQEGIRHLKESGAGPPESSPPLREINRRLTELGRQRAARWGWVNTYTYSKSIGEQWLAAQGQVDYAIVRPAIVESALQFPLPGWIEGGRTAAPLVLMAMSGMTDWPARRDLPLEIVPVDLVAAAILAVGALLLDEKHQRVYHLASADRNPFELERLIRLLAAEAHSPSNGSNPPRLPLWLDPLPRLRFLSARQARERRLRLQRRINGVQHLLNRAANLGTSFGKRLKGWSTSLRTLELQLSFREQTLEQYLPFILENRYIFEAENVRRAYRQITPEDQQRLPWRPEEIDWVDYWRVNQIEGIKKWIEPEAVRGWTFRI